MRPGRHVHRDSRFDFYLPIAGTVTKEDYKRASQMARAGKHPDKVESFFRHFMRDPLNGYWERDAKMLILLAPKKKPKNKYSRRGAHYEYAQRMGIVLIKTYTLGEEVLHFVEENLRGTPAGDSAKKALQKIEKALKKGRR